MMPPPGVPPSRSRWRRCRRPGALEGHRKLYAFCAALGALLVLGYHGALDQAAAAAVVGLYVAFCGANAGEHFAQRPSSLDPSAFLTELQRIGELGARVLDERLGGKAAHIPDCVCHACREPPDPPPGGRPP